MINQDNVELFFDILHEGSVILFNEKKFKYLDGIIANCENIIQGEILQDISDEGKEQLDNLYSQINNVELNAEEIRKAMQLSLLKAFKEHNMSNSGITPDTIGILIASFINKFYSSSKKIRIFDPVVGTGNLLTSVANNVECDTELTGIDNNQLMTSISKAMCNVQGHDLDLYYQDTLLATFKDIDVVVMDPERYSCIEEDGLSYFPYIAVKRHIESLKEDGFLFALIGADFFLGEESKIMQKIIREKCYTVGVIELPETMFKAERKSILILRKIGKEPQFSEQLISTLPSFDDKEKLEQAILKIEFWFAKIQGGLKNGQNFSS